MVCSADELVLWRDFPKGLRVLLLDEDSDSATATRLKLEAMDYIVFSFQNEIDALEATSKKADSFHVAVVEVTTENFNRSFKFLEMAKDLPTVVISNVHSLSTMMKCIALGAAEFLEKPLTEDKLRNIWQHVVHKAFNAGGNDLSRSLNPIKETASSMLLLQPGKAELFPEIKDKEEVVENENETSIPSETFPEPSTPQLNQGNRLLEYGDYHDQPNCSLDLLDQRKDNSSELKSVENTCSNLANVDNKKELSPSAFNQPACDEVNSNHGSNQGKCGVDREGMLPSRHKRDRVESLKEESKNMSTLPRIHSRLHGNRGNRRRMKVDWTADLHRRFVQAVEQLGVDQAIPSKILELMNVEGLTRHNVASHLQKFRMQRRHILPKDENMRWQQHRHPLPRNYMQKPPLVLPQFHSNYGVPQHQLCHVWGHPSHYLQSGFRMWSHASSLPWQPPPLNWPWKAYSGMNAETWGTPVAPPHHQYTFSAQTQPTSNGLDVRERSKVLREPSDVHMQAEEMIDQVLMEAMSNPWLPLPLGLKPPSIDGVLSELHRQGIRSIPPLARR